MENAKLVEDALKALETFDQAAQAYGRAKGEGKLLPAGSLPVRLYKAAKANLQRRIVALQE